MTKISIFAPFMVGLKLTQKLYIMNAHSKQLNSAPFTATIMINLANQVRCIWSSSNWVFVSNTESYFVKNYWADYPSILSPLGLIIDI